MAQGVLGFKYEEEKHDTGMAGLAGLPVYLDLLHAMGLPELIGRHLQVKQRGWTDAQMVLSLMLLNIVGGDCVEDLGKVEKDEGFCRILRRGGRQGRKRRGRGVGAFLQKGDHLKISTITFMELYYGAFKSQRPAGNLAKVKTLEQTIEIVS